MAAAGMKYMIVHPTTGDWAEAETKRAAKVAARWLRREAVQQGCSPRTSCIITKGE